MCGIVARVGGGGDLAPLLERALAALAHRGPDHQGVWLDPQAGVALGHRRLSIVDLSAAGNQPMVNEDGRLHLVGNGEIYNAPALREELRGLGHVFSSGSDNEVILHAYEAWGRDALTRLEGMFAFALWDGERRILLATRDRMGMKPLFFAPTPDGGLALASEAESLRRLLPTPPSPEPVALAQVMTMGYIPAPGSIWRGVAKLLPGQWLQWRAGEGVATGTWWEPPREVDPGVFLSVEAWGELFEGVVGEHLLADVPLGLFLSAGLDSTAVALALNRLGRRVESLTIAFPGSARDESVVALASAAHLGHRGRAIPLEGDAVDDLLAAVTAAADEPYGYTALATMYAVSREAARGFKVVLAGDGGDELFGGYDWYRELDRPLGGRSCGWRRRLRPLLRWGAPAALVRLAVNGFAQTSVLHRHAWRIFPRFLPEEAEHLLAPMGLRGFDDETLLAPLSRHFEPRLPLLRALQRVDLMTYCGDLALAKVDRASMAHALEVRVPFLDRRLVEQALSLPLTGGGEDGSKPMLRAYLRGRVPEAVLARPKQGFSLRVGSGLDEVAALGRIARGGWVCGGYWARDWRRLVAPGMPFRSARIAVLLMMTLWWDAHRLPG
ncbi:MAG: asparagine synthase (glutamine-hydrolyzing) [Magnetococcales bacterium]|nr:asparagine synthase (glutamine-hydrolyzing) [Magnetococcales bacterium]